MKFFKFEELPDDFFRPLELPFYKKVEEIVNAVKKKGDEAVRRYTKLYDRVDINSLKINEEEILQGKEKVKREFIQDLKMMISLVKKFSLRQKKKIKNFTLEVEKGVFAGQRVIPIERVGIYVPGGRYPLFSSLIMAAVPAQAAGVKEIAVATPPDKAGRISPEILAASSLLEISEVYKMGGIQAIAALALGTETIKPVDKIVGPGNIYVNAAKKYLFGEVGIDFVAGPTEIMIIGDKEADPELVASDLIAQAEHDPSSQAVLVTDSIILANKIQEEIPQQLENLKTDKTAGKALTENGWVILVSKLKEAAFIANRKAPEHLELHLENSKKIIPELKNYGTLFIGSYAAEAIGDYCGGVNHILPTNSAARYCGSLGVRDFLKIQNTLRLTRKGIKKVGPTAERLALKEGLEGHASSIRKRREGGRSPKGHPSP
ncbi:MAG: histidinol dehydrogenase [Acidobacteriota bacterium]